MTDVVRTSVTDVAPTLIPTMAMAENFSNKIAAAIERQQIRDLYDISRLQPLTPFDEETLLARFKRLSIKQAKSKAYTPKEAADLLRTLLKLVTQEKIAEELGGFLPKDHLPGLDMIIKNTVNQVIQRIEIIGVEQKGIVTGEPWEKM